MTLRIEHRIESDSMGEVRVPSHAYWGAQTQRAIDNFSISGLRMPRPFLKALGQIKETCAMTNHSLGLLDADLARAVTQAAREVRDGELDDQFPVDVFQTGSGTSTNMNANEVIANRANEILGFPRGKKSPVHPNDHVNMCQSSNDVIPTCLHLASLDLLEHQLLPAVDELKQTLEDKSREFKNLLKIGRTHLQDATPISLGQEFGGYAEAVQAGILELKACREPLSHLPLGGTAVGTGINAHPRFAVSAIPLLAEATGMALHGSPDRFAAQSLPLASARFAGAMKTLALVLFKISNDIRWLASGPRCGLGEIRLPGLQPGSSIMPGKINPVIPEVVCQAAVKVIGNEASTSLGVMSGSLELNTFLPLIAHDTLQSAQLLAGACRSFAIDCVRGIEADEARCASLIEGSLAMATPLAARLGYDAAARIATVAYTTGRTVRDVAKAEGLLPEDELAALLNPVVMAGQGSEND